MKIIGVSFLGKGSQRRRKGIMVIIIMWENAFLKRTDGIIRGFVPTLNIGGNRDIKCTVLNSKASFLLIRPVEPGAERGG